MERTRERITESRKTTLDWIGKHMEQLKQDNSSESIDDVVQQMKNINLAGSAGLTKEMLGGEKSQEKSFIFLNKQNYLISQ